MEKISCSCHGACFWARRQRSPSTSSSVKGLSWIVYPKFLNHLDLILWIWPGTVATEIEIPLEGGPQKSVKQLGFHNCERSSKYMFNIV